MATEKVQLLTPEIDPQLAKNLQLCFFQARVEGWPFFTAEQLLYVLLDNPEVLQAFNQLQVDVEGLREKLKAYNEKNAAKTNTTAGKPPEPRPSVALGRIIDRAVRHVITCGREDSTVHALDVIVSMFEEKTCHVAGMLQEAGLSRVGLVTYISHGAASEQEGGCGGCCGCARSEDDKGATPQSVLARYAQSLNERARRGDVDPLIGREDVLERVTQVLCRRRKNNPLLVGEPGVGKTAIAEGLADAIVKGHVPAVLKDKEIWALDVSSLVAGAEMRGEFEKRMKSLLGALKALPQVILFIDEIQSVVGAGGVKGGDDAGSLLKPALSRGEIPCIGATTYEDCRQTFEKDRALARRFEKIDITEPSPEDTVKILGGLRKSFEAFHHVKYTEEALQAAVDLSVRYMSDKRLPDKAIDVIDEAGATRRAAGKRSRSPIGKAEIEAVVSRIARVPVTTVGKTDTEKLRNLEMNLKKTIFGQDPAIENVASAIRMSRSGLGRNGRPVGAFLFAGPTGVGKTEVARQLAAELGVELIRFDMSEYAERHTVSRLLGAPPGYVGFEKGGEMTEALVKHPHSVLLLDELEKAHPDIYNILLQVMDHGKLTDANGRTVDFTNTVLIMTTNAGADQLAKKSIGFGSGRGFEMGDPMAAICKIFTPEFRNRLDAIVMFSSLGEAEILRVARKFLGELERQLVAKTVTVHFTEGLEAMLVKKGFDPAMGARPMQRLIQDTVRKVLADELLFGRLTQGGSVTVDVNEEGKPVLRFED